MPQKLLTFIKHNTKTYRCNTFSFYGHFMVTYARSTQKICYDIKSYDILMPSYIIEII